jgi:type I restriction enzyme S subunit
VSTQLIPLGEVADFINGVAFKPEDWGDEGRPIIRIQNLNDPAKPFNRTTRSVSDKHIARAGDLLVSWSASLGVYEWSGEEACVNQHIFKVVPNGKRVEVKYLRRALEASIGEMESQVHGATMKHITRDKFLGVRIPLPPLPEQRRIAAILDKADALRAKRREAIAKLHQLLQSVFLDMFGDPATNPKGWPTSRFEDLCINEDFKRQPIKAADREERSGPYPYYGASGVIDTFDAYIFDGERLLIAEDGANLVMRSSPIAFMARGKYWVNNHAHVVAENDKADLRYLEGALERFDLKPYISGSAQPKLNQANLARVAVPVPPLSLQRTYRAVCERIEAARTRLERNAALIGKLFEATQNRSFTVELSP